MAGESRIDILIAARDQAKSTIQGVKAELSSLDQAAGTAAGGIGAMSAALGVVGAIKLGQQVVELAQMAAQAGRVEDSFRQMQASVGQSADATLAALQKASRGTIADTQLELNANRARLLGVATTAEQLTQLLQAASVRGKILGTSTAQAFNDIVTGIGRMSPLILDNLGIMTGGQATFDAYAASIGKSSEELTDAEKKQALFNKVISDTKPLIEAAGNSALDGAGKFERLAASWENFRVAFGKNKTVEFGVNVSADILDELAKKGPVGASISGWTQVFDIIRNGKGATDETTASVTNLANILPGFGASTGAAADAQQRYALHARVAAQANYEENASVITLAGSLPGLTAELNKASAALAGARAASVARIASAAAGVEDIVGQAQAQRLFGDALGQTDAKIAAVNADFAAGKLTQDEFQLRLAEIGQVGNDTFSQIRKAQAEADAGAKQYASTLENEVKQAYENLKSKVSGIISGAMSLNDIGIDPNKILLDPKETDPKKQQTLLPREDAIQENAFRLADIAVKGFDSPWAEYFKTKFPAMWAQNFAGAGNNVDLRRQAATLLKNFQDGLEPELLDKEKAKERVRRMILGEQKTAELVKEITDELNSELGSAAPSDLKSLVKQSLGGGATGQAGAAFGGPDVLSGASSGGASAAQAFVSGATQGMGNVGGQMIDALDTQLRADANLNKLGQAGALGGTKYGSEFLTNAINNISKPFIDAVSAIVTGNVIAYQNTQNQLTGVTP